MDNLAEIIKDESGHKPQNILFLRHGNRSVRVVRECKMSLFEYSEIQPKNTVFDYWKEGEEKAKVIVVVVNDRVWGVFAVNGILDEGKPEEILSPANLAYNELEDKPRRRTLRKFDLAPLASSLIGKRVSGWEGKQRTIVARHWSSFYNDLKVV